MTNSITVDNYTVSVSLNEKTIFLSATDTTTLIKYECTIDPASLRNHKIYFELDEVYGILRNCLAREVNYNVVIRNDSGCLHFTFDGMLGGLVKFLYKCVFTERSGQVDPAVLSKYQQTIDSLRVEVDELRREVVSLKKDVPDITCGLLFHHKLGGTEIPELTTGQNGISIAFWFTTMHAKSLNSMNVEEQQRIHGTIFNLGKDLVLLYKPHAPLGIHLSHNIIYSNSLNFHNTSWVHLTLAFYPCGVVRLYANATLAFRRCLGYPESRKRTNNYVGSAVRYGEVLQFEGKLADFRIYDRIITPLEISKIMEEDNIPIL